jgi:hypothetical protein
MAKDITREQIDILGLLAEGYVLRQRQDRWMLTGKGWVIAPPGGDSAVDGLRDLEYVVGSTLSDEGRKVWEEWCAANPQLVPKKQ